MPIVDKSFDYARVQRDGTVRVRERHRDSLGHDYYFVYTAASQAEANTLLANRDLTVTLNDAEEVRLYEHIVVGGTIDTFTFTDLTLTEGRRRMLLRCARAELRVDRMFLCNIAFYVAQFTAQQIANAANISLEVATKVLNRAVRLRDVICPALIADDGDIQL